MMSQINPGAGWKPNFAPKETHTSLCEMLSFFTDAWKTSQDLFSKFAELF